MDSLPINPVHWRKGTLIRLEAEDIHELAARSVGTLTCFRLILGRCLLALQETEAYKNYGCASVIHYACVKLGICPRVARTCRRVALALEELPELSLAAEAGSIDWSKLREIVRKASPATETFWLKLASTRSYTEIEALVQRTPPGSIPGEADQQEQSYRTELRCALAPGVGAMLEHARRCYSLESGEAVTTAQVVEKALASYIAGREVDEKVLEKVRNQANRDLLAQQARRLPVVAEARELAVSMGLLNREEESEGAPGHTHEDHRTEETPGRPDKGGAGEGQLAEEALGRPHQEHPDAETPGGSAEVAELSREPESEECLGLTLKPLERGASAQKACQTQGVAVNEGSQAAAGGTFEARSHAVKKDSEAAGSLIGSVDLTLGRLLAEALGCPHEEQLAAEPLGCSYEEGLVEEMLGCHHQEHLPAEASRPFTVTDPHTTWPARVKNGSEHSQSPTSDPLSQETNRPLPLNAAGGTPSDTAGWSNNRLRFNPKNRFPTRAQRQELLRRDGWCCRTPGCPHQVWLHLHHLHEYAQGGTTIPDNLLGLCAACHRNLHDGLLQIQNDAEGRLVFSDAQGRRLDRQRDLELATWLDFHLGWNGQEYDSHWIRANKNEWAVYQWAS